MEQSEQTLISTCDDCGRSFIYQIVKRRKIRRVCPSCVRLRRLEDKKKYNRRIGRVKADRIQRGSNSTGRPNESYIKNSQAEIARVLRLKKHEVEKLEAQALQKMRNAPELKNLWDSFKEVLADGHRAGDNRLSNLMHGLSVDRQEQGLRLLEYQMAVVEFWESYDDLTEKMQKYGVDMRIEILECLREIKQFQKKIGDCVAATFG